MVWVFTFAVSANKGQWDLHIKFNNFWLNVKKNRIVAALLMVSALVCGPALAQSEPSSVRLDGARIILLSAPSMASALLRDSITLEQDERLAFVSIELDEGWKTYWRLPGRFGLAPVLDWSTSENVGSLTTIFPLPSLFDEGDGTSIGYFDDVLWPVRVQPIDPKEPVILSLTIELGLCEELCFPVSADLSARLSPSAGDVASMVDILALAGYLPADELMMMPAGAFQQNEGGLTLTLDQGATPDGFAVAENEEGKHGILRSDGSGTLRGPWRHEAAPSTVTVISPEFGMQLFQLGT